MTFTLEHGYQFYEAGEPKPDAFAGTFSCNGTLLKIKELDVKVVAVAP